MMTRNNLIAFFHEVRRLTEDICQPLTVEDHVIQPVMDVSPPKWHMGHTSWFFEAMFLDKMIENYRWVNQQYPFVFNSYYESFGQRIDRNTRGHMSRPTLAETLEYRSIITERMCELIDSVDEAQYPQFSKLVILGLNHEQQHQELLLTDIKYILASSPLRPAYQMLPERVGQHNALPPLSFVPFTGGIYEIGYQGEGFYYDNERPVHKQYVHDFAIGDRLVTNGEYLQFIEDGGYRDFRWWLSDGWDTVKSEGWTKPLYWEQIDGQWYEFTLGGLQPLNPSAPVCHVSYFEADAYAQWRGKRLPTEAEWEVAARVTKQQPQGKNFFDKKYYHPVPLDAGEAQQEGIKQMLGDVWEWTRSSYLPYPGYRRQAGPLGEYNGKFMVNQMVLRGGSCATSANHIRITYRNFFQTDKRWQFKGIRLAEDL
jgi:ergothioneine biosynthesis protein EgtB